MTSQSIEDLGKQLRQYRRSKPFVPFEVVLDTGKRYQVTDPLHFAWDGYKMLVFVPQQGAEVFRVEHIVDIHELSSH